MNILYRISPWLNRVLLGFVIFIFTMIGVRNLITPVKSNEVFKITLGSPEAITNTRVGLGAFPLAFAIILFYHLVTNKKHLTGLVMVAVMDGLLTIVRIIGATVDGPAEWTLKIMRPEIAILVFSIIAITLEVNKRKLIPGLDI